MIVHRVITSSEILLGVFDACFLSHMCDIRREIVVKLNFNNFQRFFSSAVIEFTWLNSLYLVKNGKSTFSEMDSTWCICAPYMRSLGVSLPYFIVLLINDFNVRLVSSFRSGNFYEDKKKNENFRENRRKSWEFRKRENINDDKPKRTENERTSRTGVDGIMMNTRDRWSNGSMNEDSTRKTEEATTVTNNGVTRGSLIFHLESSKGTIF